MATATSAKKKAPVWTATALPDTRMARHAPNAAPELTPRMRESTRGFRKSPWRTAPAAARSAPTTSAASVRGSRTWTMSERSRSPVPEEKSDRNASPTPPP
jgi:hypothetical protein